MRTLTLTSLLLSVLLLSCEEPIELDVPPQIVLQTRIQAGLSPIVTIRLVDGVGNPINSEVLKESEVSIRPRSAEQITLQSISATDVSSTFTNDFIVEAGETYTLLIKTPGFADLRSVTAVPERIPFRSNNQGNDVILPNGEFFYIPVAFDDRPDEGNYFHMVLSIRNAESEEGIASEPLAFRLEPHPTDASPFEDTGWMFSDETFADDTFIADILVPKSLVAEFTKPVVTLDLRSVSVDYYNYHLQNSVPKNGTLPDSGPVGVIDNVAGGVGLFGGYSSTETSYILAF